LKILDIICLANPIKINDKIIVRKINRIEKRDWSFRLDDYLSTTGRVIDICTGFFSKERFYRIIFKDGSVMAFYTDEVERVS